MTSHFFSSFSRSFFSRSVLLATVAAGLVACSSAPQRPQPADLGANVPLLGVRSAWSLRLGTVDFPLQPGVAGNLVAVASSDGLVAMIDAQAGRELWRAQAGAPLVAGVGTDGRVASAVTTQGDVIAWAEGREIWRKRLSAQAYTAPLVAGGRVFVLAGDRSVTAMDGQSGTILWRQQRGSEPLVLSRPGVLIPVGEVLVAGLSGRLTGLDANSGTVRWEAPLATPRGINDIERLVDISAPASRLGDSLCARAFQSTVGCVNTARGTLVWSAPANGANGLAGNDTAVFGAESDGTVVAWRRSNGERLWATERLRYRSLSGPLALGRSVIVGDGTGLVHLLSREDGAPLNRLSTDGSAIVTTPALVGNTLVVVTRSGGVFGFVPD